MEAQYAALVCILYLLASPGIRASGPARRPVPDSEAATARVTSACSRTLHVTSGFSRTPQRSSRSLANGFPVMGSSGVVLLLSHASMLSTTSITPYILTQWPGKVQT